MGIRAVLPNRDADQRLKLRWARGRPNFLNEWWPGVELNHRHADFQSAALPTELPGQPVGRVLDRGVWAPSSKELDKPLIRK